MKEQLKEKIIESVSSVLPITVIVLILSFTLSPMPAGTLILFILGAVLLTVGMGFFSLGTDMSMMTMGSETGRSLAKSKKLLATLFVCFIIGSAITVSEPDLQVLAKQVPAVPDIIIVLTVALGVGIFLAVSVLRDVYDISLRKLFIIFYSFVFILSFFVPKEFLAVAFDSGGVTTGPVTVPFIIAFGIGMASAKKKYSEESNFGLVALCSIGPILSVLIMGIVLKNTNIVYEPFSIPYISDSKEVGRQFAYGFPVYLKEVAVGLLPVMVLFMLFQLWQKSISKKKIIKIAVGTVYTYIGLVLFLTGVNVGFMPAGNFIGSLLSSKEYSWALVPIGVVIGYFIVIAEPAVHVLNKQVEELTNGAVPQNAMMTALSFGVAVSVGLSMVRVLTGLSIYWFIIPGYALALTLSFFVPSVFTSIAFDSGGVASGPMTAAFLLPFAMGACEGVNGNVLTDAFGIVAMVAMTPLIAIQLLGVIYNRKLALSSDVKESEADYITDDITVYDEEGENV